MLKEDLVYLSSGMPITLNEDYITNEKWMPEMYPIEDAFEVYPSRKISKDENLTFIHNFSFTEDTQYLIVKRENNEKVIIPHHKININKDLFTNLDLSKIKRLDNPLDVKIGNTFIKLNEDIDDVQITSNGGLIGLGEVVTVESIITLGDVILGCVIKSKYGVIGDVDWRCLGHIPKKMN